MKRLTYLTSFIFLVCGLFVMAHSAHAQYVCGQSPCWNPGPGSWNCNAGLTCSGNSGTCGANVNICFGNECRANVWDQGAHGCANECNNGGTTNTSWYSACNPSCGMGTKHCNCSILNNCPGIQCNDGQVAACGSDTATCCTTTAPQAPFNVTCPQHGISRNVDVSWDYGVGTGCGQAFGYACGGNNDRFILKYSVGANLADQTVSKNFHAAQSQTVSKWGANSVTVCANNGVAETCAPTCNFVLNAPPCTVSNLDVANATPNDQCISSYPQLQAQPSNNADEVKFIVNNANSFSDPYTAPPYLYASNWLPGSPASYVATLNNSGTYYWNVVSHSSVLPIPECITPAVLPAGFTLNVDRDPPTTPIMNPVPAFTVNQNCLSEYFMTVNWPATTDNQCAGMDLTTPYHAQIASDSAFTKIADDSVWMSSRTLTTKNAFTSVGTAKQLFARAQARDSIGNTSNYSDFETYNIPLPTAYPPITIRGTYVEDIGHDAYNTCVEGMTIDTNNLLLDVDVVGAGQTHCTVNANDYVCTIILDNQSVKCMVPDHTVKILNQNTIYDGYTSLEWRDNTCSGAGRDIQIDASTPPPGTVPTPIVAKLYFKYGQKSWFKTSGVSFNNLQQRTNIIPNNTIAYDTDDNVNPPENKYLIANGGGAVLQRNGADLSLGANATQNGKPTYSANNWYTSNYDAASNFTPSKFADYMRSRKAYKNIATTSAILTDGIYYYSGSSMAIDSGAFFKDKKVVIVADNTAVDITGNIAVGTGALAIIAKGINVLPTVSRIDGILIANTIDIGPDTPVNTTPLKIDGNLIQLSAATEFKNTRFLPDNRQPSLFVKLNQASYIKLLDYLSISVYDWKQIQ